MSIVNKIPNTWDFGVLDTRRLAFNLYLPPTRAEFDYKQLDKNHAEAREKRRARALAGLEDEEAEPVISPGPVLNSELVADAGSTTLVSAARFGASAKIDLSNAEEEEQKSLEATWKARQSLKNRNAPGLTFARLSTPEIKRAELEREEAQYAWTAEDGSMDAKLPPLLWVVNVCRSILSDRLVCEMLNFSESRPSGDFPGFVFAWFQTQAQEEKVYGDRYLTQPCACRAPYVIGKVPLKELSVDAISNMRREQFLRGLITYSKRSFSEWTNLLVVFSMFLQEEIDSNGVAFCLGFVMHAIKKPTLPVVCMYLI